MSFDVLKDYFREIRNIPVLSFDEERELVIKAQKGNEKARIKLIRSNLRLVVKVARKYERLGMSLPDLIEEGNIGLMKALSRFKVELGFRFSTYASWWIRQHVIRGLANQSRVVRIPVYMTELLHKMRKAQEKLTQKYGRRPTDQEIAKSLGCKVSKVHKLKKAQYNASSLDRRVSEEGDIEFIDLLQDDEIEAVDELVNLFEKEEVAELLLFMDERSRSIIKLRFGLESGLPKTLAEISRKFNITRERVRQIEKEALLKMREIITSDKPLMRTEKKEEEALSSIEPKKSKTKKTKVVKKTKATKKGKPKSKTIEKKVKTKVKTKVKAKAKIGKVAKAKKAIKKKVIKKSPKLGKAAKAKKSIKVKPKIAKRVIKKSSKVVKGGAKKKKKR
ncbi:MAG: RNA polymerase sigma factor RpoD/SigA [Candidatus Kaelpia aquatica]|nr:RNA polymerase sigma factor RpoD/SigA [Candidatus Kaelpia aquatica]